MSDDNATEAHPELIEIALALLSFAAGSMDALAFFDLGQVFPSAMTGNTALLGLELGRGNLMDAMRPFLAFAGFVGGASIASAWVESPFSGRSTSRMVWRLLTIEVCILAVFAVWRISDEAVGNPALYGLIIIASAAMGIQSVAARLVDRFGISTVVFTSTLTAIVATSLRAVVKPPHALPFVTRRQIGMFLTYGVGAGVGGGLAAFPAAVSALPLLAVVGAATLHWRAARATETGTLPE
jgi:uncharacterized membrane protein YoaK (UPF0700 family)